MGKGKGKGKGAKSSPTADVPLVSSTKKQAKVYFCGSDVISLDLAESFDKNSQDEKSSLLDLALSKFEQSNSIGIKCDWQESASLPMDTDIDGNVVGFMYCEEHFTSKREQVCAAIQKSLIEEDEQKQQMKKGITELL